MTMNTDFEIGLMQMQTNVEIRLIMNPLRRFQDLDQCQQFIETTSPKDRVILIASGRLG